LAVHRVASCSSLQAVRELRKLCGVHPVWTVKGFAPLHALIAPPSGANQRERGLPWFPLRGTAMRTMRCEGNDLLLMPTQDGMHTPLDQQRHRGLGTEPPIAHEHVGRMPCRV
jgi:hypothetical protein